MPEYWIVDASKNRITILTLEDGFYEEGDRVRS
ncbi:MAG: Uma2 family endonuclease [Hormoscilla sp. SP5CHS1]|nr:Uma2 family endonuclease [Hormoscilla sp. SP12CHS1]MBC6453790.1 Uma2 family endonuclease [Hormoscilla sp. SP5CHS1]